jgi:host factor-I protein
MSQTSDTRVLPPNVQDGFLNIVRRERRVVSIRLMDGTDLEGRIKHFDRFALILELDGGDQMVFKHAIAFIRSPRHVDPLENGHS